LTAATRALTDAKPADTARKAIRAHALAEFDKNGNGTLERQEIRSALASVNAKSHVDRWASRSKGSAASITSESTRSSDRTAAQASVASCSIEHQLINGLDAQTAESLAIQRFDTNGDGMLDDIELAVAQAAMLRQAALAASSALTQATNLTTAATGTGVTGTTVLTGTTGTGTTTTGTTTGETGHTCPSAGAGTGTGTTPTTSGAQSSAANTQAGGAAAGRFGGAAGRGFGGGFRGFGRR
jgi:hypothetical protein